MEQQQIYDTKQFPFSRVNLGKPFNKQGMYFIKMYVGESPIFIQPPKCVMKQAVMKSGKKLFCDLVFSMENGYFLTWLEKIEEIAKQKIFENRAVWFETELDEHDIENSLVSPYKMYKSGKFFIIRANFPTTLGKCDLKIYDENENIIPHEDLKEDTDVITIVELKGIKCSARSFQFEFDVRQMLVVSPEKLFEKCIIKKNTTHTTTNTAPDTTYETNSESSERTKPTTIQPSISVSSSSMSSSSSDVSETKPQSVSTTSENYTSASLGQTEKSEVYEETKQSGSVLQPYTTSNNRNEPPKTPETTLELCEIDFDLAELEKNEVVQLKPRNDVYYKMYKEVKRKAKEAKMIALSNYLEAKRLKTTYLLEDSSDSSDYDTEPEQFRRGENGNGANDDTDEDDE